MAGPLAHPERVYVEGLIRNARERRKIPVLTDTRTLGRFPALRDAFPGRHVLLFRNAFHQWASYTEQWAHGNGYFLDMLFRTVEGARSDPTVRLLSDWFAAGDRTPANPATFQLFLLFHFYLYAHAYDAADLVVDVNRVAAEPTYRTKIEAALGEYVRAPIDLSDARAFRPVAVRGRLEAGVPPYDRAVLEVDDRQFGQLGGCPVRHAGEGRCARRVGPVRVLQRRSARVVRDQAAGKGGTYEFRR